MSETKKDLLMSRGWCHLPKVVLFDPKLTPTEKIMFAYITSYMAQTGYCWMSNNFLAEQFNVTRVWVSSTISKLTRLGYFSVEYIREAGKKEVKERHIYLGEGINQAINRCQSTDEEVVIESLIGSNREFKENKNNKNKNNKNKNNKNKKLSISKEAKELTEHFHKNLIREMPNIKLQNNYKDKWSLTFDKILRIDKRPLAQIEKVIDHCFDIENSWWAKTKNVRTPCKLRMYSKTQGIMYYDLILSEMQDNGVVSKVVNVEDF